MALNTFIRDIDLFLEDKLTLDVFIVRLEAMEDTLLDIEEANKNEKLRYIILKTLEILDNINIAIDEAEQFDKNSSREKLKKFQSLLIEINSLHSDKKTEQGKTEKTNFILSIPEFEAHPGMKSKLPLQQNSDHREITELIDNIKKFSRGQIKDDIIFDKLETVEDKLLEMEEFTQEGNKKFRDIILQALETLDNIRMLIEQNAHLNESKLNDELEKWLNLQNHLKVEYVHQVFPETSSSNPLSPDVPGITSKKGEEKKTDTSGRKIEQFMLAKPSFEVHPVMKSRLQVQLKTETEEEETDKEGTDKEGTDKEGTDKFEEKSSPLYNFLKTGKKYLSGEKNLSEFNEILESTSKEISDLKQEIEKQITPEEDEKESLAEFASILGSISTRKNDRKDKEKSLKDNNRKRKEFTRILEEILEVCSCISQNLKEETSVDELRLFIEDLEDLNGEIIIHLKDVYIAAGEVDEEEDLIKHITGRISEEDYITSNYLLIKETSSKFLEEKINETDFKEVLDDMKKLIQEAREDYEEAFITTDGWTLESSIGDRILREGIKDWKEGLDYLYEACITGEEDTINKGLKKIFEGNKKLIINQKLEEYIQEQVKIRSEYGLNYSPL